MAVGAQMSPWHQVAEQATQIGIAPVVAPFLDTNMATGGSSDSRHHVVLGGNMGHDVNTDPGCGRTTDPDMTLINSWGPDTTIAPG